MAPVTRSQTRRRSGTRRRFEFAFTSKRGIGYKRLRGDKIAVIRIMGINNETRTVNGDKRFAKYRCSEAKVLRIEDVNDPTKTYTCGFSLYGVRYHSIMYKPGETVVPDSYDLNLGRVATHGIHYFKTREAAASFGVDGLHTGVYVMGDLDYGTVRLIITFKDQKRDGPAIEYGSVAVTEAFYANNVKHGFQRFYTRDGELYRVELYQHGQFLDEWDLRDTSFKKIGACTQHTVPDFYASPDEIDWDAEWLREFDGYLSG